MDQDSTRVTLPQPQGARSARRPESLSWLDEDTVVDAPAAPSLMGLMDAAQVFSLQQITHWVACGADVAAADANGVTPLMRAASRGHLDMVAYLVGRGIAVNAMDRRGYTAFAWAAHAGHRSVVAYLKSRGANPNAVAPLFTAARRGRTEILQLMWQHGAHLGLRDRRGNSLLLVAALHGHLRVVRWLLAQKVDKSLTNHRGHNALGLALHAGHFRVAALLHTGRDTYNPWLLLAYRLRRTRWLRACLPQRTRGL